MLRGCRGSLDAKNVAELVLVRPRPAFCLRSCFLLVCYRSLAHLKSTQRNRLEQRRTQRASTAFHLLLNLRTAGCSLASPIAHNNYSPYISPKDMDNCDNCEAKKAAFEACMMRESTSLSGMKYFGSGAIVGAALTLAVPRGVTSVWIRQAPFFVLGLSGIAADYYAIQSLCARESG